MGEQEYGLSQANAEQGDKLQELPIVIKKAEIPTHRKLAICIKMVI